MTSIKTQKTKTIILEINITGSTQDNALDKQKAILDELYKIKIDSKDCVLEIKPETTASTYFEILNYAIQISRTKEFKTLPTIKQISLILNLLVDNYGYASETALGNEGFNVLMNNKKVAGQLVPHSHVHIIPRFSGDGIDLNWKPNKYNDKEIDEFKEKIKSFL